MTEYELNETLEKLELHTDIYEADIFAENNLWISKILRDSFITKVVSSDISDIPAAICR